MFEADPTTMVTFAHETAGLFAQAGIPTDLPAQVPEFVGNILAELGNSVGDAMGGLGETISGLTPGGGDTAGRQAASGAMENAPGR